MGHPADRSGEALHSALLAAAREAGCDAREGKKGWTEAGVRSLEFDRLRDEHSVRVDLVWTKQHLLSTRRGYPYPRLTLLLPPGRWNGQSRDMLAKATRPVAHELGMKKRDAWWAHWGMLDPIAESQDLRSYADNCVARLQDASRLLYPVLVEVIAATPVRP